MRLAASLLLATAFLAGAVVAETPRPAGPLDIVSYTGQRIRLSDLKGKVVVLEFLLTYCPGCKHSAGILAQLQREYGPAGLQVIGLAIDDGAGPKIPQFVRETGANFPVGVLSNDKAHEYLQVPLMSRMMMPQVAVVDRRGMLREQHAGDDPWMAPAIEEMNLRKAIEKLLAERPGRAPAQAAPKAAPKK
jgi:cytochrome c biogenesis protein CcmG/thiol:disulfide interchange protein DsbE